MLALGIGANTAVFSIVNTLVLQPRMGRIDTLVAVFNRDRVKRSDFSDFSYPAYVDLRDRSGVFDSLLAHCFTTVGIRDGALTRQAFATIVSANYFETLGVRLAAGREIQSLDSRMAVLWARTMTMQRDESISSWSVRAAASLFSAFGVLALLLATIGVYGLKAYDVSRRTHEIGIQMALGATAGDVERLVMREGVRATAIGLGIGLLLAAGIGKLLSGMLYRVSPFDPVVMTIAAAVLSTAAMLACYFPARRATRIVPLEALRSE